MRNKIYFIVIFTLLVSCNQIDTTQEATEVTTGTDSATVEMLAITDSAVETAQKTIQAQETKNDNPLSDNEIIDAVKQIIIKMNKSESLDYSYELKEGQPITVADLNKDGYNDAIAVISGGNTSGGNSWREDVAVFLNNPQTNKIKHYKDLNAKYDLKYKTIDKIELIDDGTFIISAKGYKDEDAQCCPTLPIKLLFGFIGNEIKNIKK
ncbi:MAG: hypothetical protein U0T07_09555 [Chitinophagales bacterium]